MEQQSLTERLFNILRVPELRKRVLFTLGALVIFRIGAHIPVPGVDVHALEAYFRSYQMGLLNLVDLFAGGALKRFTIFALGIMPYISASIVMQLLTVVIPSLEKLSKEGEYGRKKLHQYSRYLTILICIIQSYGLTAWMKSMQAPDGSRVVPEPTFGFTLLAIVTITTGTIFLMWLGERITEKGIGNGISLLITAGIVARYPMAFAELITKVKLGEIQGIMIFFVLALFVAVIAFVVLVETAERRIPIQYAHHVHGRRVYGAQTTYLPLKLNPASVMPIIFAAAIILFPGQLASFLGDKMPIFRKIALYLAPGTPLYLVIYAALIIFFTYFYTAIIFNPQDVAENLRKFGGFIPGIRPGQNTAEYLNKLLNRIILSGALFVAFIAVFPSLVRKWLNLPSGISYLMGGTSLLIVIGVTLDTMKQIEGYLLTRHYEGFLARGKTRGRRGWL